MESYLFVNWNTKNQSHTGWGTRSPHRGGDFSLDDRGANQKYQLAGTFTCQSQ